MITNTRAITDRYATKLGADPQRLYDHFVRIATSCADQARLKKDASTTLTGAAIIGLCAPQGAGKTTLTSALVEILAAQGLRAIAISIDDFYLTRTEHVGLAEQSPNNPYLQARGYPGTHDIELGERTLDRLARLGRRESLAIPSYDKSANQGHGDRKREAEWPSVSGPLDIVLLEGWMLGFPPRANDEPPIDDPSLAEIDQRFRMYDRWTQRLDAFVFLKPQKPEFVVQWRIEAEEKMKASGRAGLSREAIEAYVRSFLPAYELYLPKLCSRLPVPREHSLILEIGVDRLPL